MKRKLLVGLLTIAACFTVGSTSFAAEAPSSTLSSSTSISPNAVIKPIDETQAIVRMQVGETIWLTGYNFWYINYDGSIEIIPAEGKFTALHPGTSTVAADFGNGITFYYIILVN
ncbi:hypothetical protein QW71_14475 [Paenibacillus sp. IHB B 3415]|uniref:hypothetical protein n=1 Tax=Paenibacillus sp. IHB B 3415 TaxID=867080 RepID=UPI000573F6CA|nr:hypothetical protein [Paenibacillus sp. IHB B 3415]KHL95197.1 hypothetical protein QW71_14475 [Paenibacillus sp. IHB B 3415]